MDTSNQFAGVGNLGLLPAVGDRQRGDDAAPGGGLPGDPGHVGRRLGSAVRRAPRQVAYGLARALVAALRAVAGLVLRILDLVWLGDPVRVLGWCLVDLARRVKSGQGERLFGLWLVVGLYG